MIEIENITIGYEQKPLVEGFTLRAEEGACILLSGRNGSGKTTLMKTLAGQIPPLAGTLPRIKAVMVPTRIPKVKGFTVREFILLASERRDLPAAEEAMEILQIGPLADRDISTLSDGQFQKACIATALSRKAALILLDEPTAFLDTESRIQVLSAIKEAARKSGSCILFSSHDLHEARQIADREICLDQGGRGCQ